MRPSTQVPGRRVALQRDPEKRVPQRKTSRENSNLLVKTLTECRPLETKDQRAARSLPGSGQHELTKIGEHAGAKILTPSHRNTITIAYVFKFSQNFRDFKIGFFKILQNVDEILADFQQNFTEFCRNFCKFHGISSQFRMFMNFRGCRKKP